MVSFWKVSLSLHMEKRVSHEWPAFLWFPYLSSEYSTNKKKNNISSQQAYIANYFAEVNIKFTFYRRKEAQLAEFVNSVFWFVFHFKYLHEMSSLKNYPFPWLLCPNTTQIPPTPPSPWHLCLPASLLCRLVLARPAFRFFRLDPLPFSSPFTQ